MSAAARIDRDTTRSDPHPTALADRAATRYVAIAWVLFWVLMAAVALQDYLRAGGRHPWEPLLWEGSSALVATLLLYVQQRFNRTNDRWLAEPRRWFGRQFLWLPVFCLAFVALVFAIRHGVYGIAGREYRHDPWPETLLYESIKLSLFFGIWSAVLFGVKSYRALADERVEIERVRSSLREAQLRQLSAQIQPHFLFNSLNLVSSTMHEDVARADALLTRLADLLRAALAMGDAPAITFAEELRLLRAYGAIMAERFAGRVEIEYEVDPAADGCRVPPFTLQPLLENVFKHTVERQRAPTRIRIEVRRDASRVVATIEDDRGTLGGGAAGIGLANVRSRLEAVHGAGASLTLEPRSPAGVRARVVVPCAS